MKKDIEAYILKTVEKTISGSGMFKKGDKVLIGVSGGPDSVALADILFKLAPKYSIKLGIAHLNHSLRGKDSDDDAEFVLAFSNNLGLQCYVEKINVKEYQKQHKLSLEHAARRVRYDFFNRIFLDNKFDKIALGHHADDNAEMILISLFRGSGLLGLSGIPPIRDNIIIRPLINLNKSEILEYLSKRQLSYVNDRTNKDVKFLRNRIRHNLIPILRDQYNPKIIDSLNRLSSIIRSDEYWIKEILRPVFKSTVKKIGDNEFSLFIPGLSAGDLGIKRRIIRMVIEKVKTNLKKITLDHIDSIIRLLEKGPIQGSLDLPDKIMVRRDNNYLIFSKETRPLRMIGRIVNQKVLHDFSYQILKPINLNICEINARISFLEIDIEKLPDICSAGQNTAFFDINKIKYPLTLRNYKKTDRFKPLGMTGSKTVEKFLSEKKASRDIRALTPVLLDKDKIIWVAGYGIEDSVKITQLTKRVLKAEFHTYAESGLESAPAI